MLMAVMKCFEFIGCIKPFAFNISSYQAFTFWGDPIAADEIYHRPATNREIHRRRFNHSSKQKVPLRRTVLPHGSRCQSPEIRASACVSMYSLMAATFPFSTIIVSQSFMNGLFVALTPECL